MYGDYPVPQALIHTARVGQPTAAEPEEAAAYEREQEAGWEKMMDEPSPNGKEWLHGLYRGNLDWLVPGTIFLTKHGSQAYGTSLPTSDTDYKGVAIPPAHYFMGFHQRFEQAEIKEPDLVIYDIRKFFDLAADCNPNIIEVLWTDPADHVIRDALAEDLLAHRDLFISRKARWTFSGYAMSQLKRIKLHRRWLLSPPKEEPARRSFGLPESTMVPAEHRGLVHAEMERRGANVGKSATEEEWCNQAAGLGIPAEVVAVLWRERSYHNARKEWEQYQNWRATRNPARAQLEAAHGYDCKHATHLVRLLRMGREILRGEGVIVKRPDAAELLEIRNGAWSFDRLIAWAEEQETAMETEYTTSPLRQAPDRAKLDALCVRIVEAGLRR